MNRVHNFNEVQLVVVCLVFSRFNLKDTTNRGASVLKKIWWWATLTLLWNPWQSYIFHISFQDLNPLEKMQPFLTSTQRSWSRVASVNLSLTPPASSLIFPWPKILGLSGGYREGNSCPLVSAPFPLRGLTCSSMSLARSSCSSIFKMACRISSLESFNLRRKPTPWTAWPGPSAQDRFQAFSFRRWIPSLLSLPYMNLGVHLIALPPQLFCKASSS